MRKKRTEKGWRVERNKINNLISFSKFPFLKGFLSRKSVEQHKW